MPYLALFNALHCFSDSLRTVLIEKFDEGYVDRLFKLLKLLAVLMYKNQHCSRLSLQIIRSQHLRISPGGFMYARCRTVTEACTFIIIKIIKSHIKHE